MDDRPAPPRRPAPRALAALALLALAAAACGGGDGAPAAARDFSARAVGEAFDPEAQAQVLNSALGAGPNRLAFGLFRSDGSLILDAAGSVRLYRLDGSGAGTFAAEHELQRAAVAHPAAHRQAAGGGEGGGHAHAGEFAAIFYAHAVFDRPGDWGAELAVEIGGESRRLLAQPFNVLARTPEPQVGDPLPASAHLTLRDVDDIAAVSSAPEPIPAMHELTVAEALATGQPVLVAVATPAFCRTRFCGPMLEEVVAPLWEEFGGAVRFVHVEPFDLAEARSNGRLAPVSMMAEWRLQTEPWIFVADRAGLVAAKFEGVAAVGEVREALEAVAAPGP